MNGNAKNRSRTFVRADDRPGYAAGLRALADVIETNPDVPIPSGATIDLFVHGDDADDEKTAARTLLRTFGGTWDKQPSDNYLIFRGWLHGLPVNVWVARESVCERVVVGTETVTETVPVGEDPRPVETVTREVERVEWVCSPLLADTTPQAVSA